MMMKLRKFFGQSTGAFRCERGQTAIEYALVAVVIIVVLVFAFRNAHVECGISASASRVQNTMENYPP